MQSRYRIHTLVLSPGRRPGGVTAFSWTKFSPRKISVYSICFSTFLWIWFWFRQQRKQQLEAGDSTTPNNIRMGAAQRRQYTNVDATSSSSIDHPKKMMTAYLEPIDLLWMKQRPLPPRNTSASILTAVTFPQVSCLQDRVKHFPVDDYPTEDPFLPWIHDYFPTTNGSYIQFVAQNKRKCNTGLGHEATMKYWEPQVSFYQPVPVDMLLLEGKPTLSSSTLPKYRLGTSPDNATFPETRFICHFHNRQGIEATTLSDFAFNYEHVTWRKSQATMWAAKGKDSAQYWQSQLLFRCPVPTIFQEDIRLGRHGIRDNRDQWISQLWMDLVPIRTPPRLREFLFTERHVGSQHLKGIQLFDTEKAWGIHHVLPAVSDSGRWANLPICLPPRVGNRNNLQSKSTRHENGIAPEPATTSTKPVMSQKTFRLVACTWTAASYTRKGETLTLTDGEKRLREWIVFHLMVGFDHLYVYDNTQLDPSPLLAVTVEFQDRVTYHPWPYKICNNNYPIDANPGEWSSQHAAESSCRERYGPSTEWMAFIDTDEYLVPIARPNISNHTPHWHAVLDTIDINTSRVLKMKSSRGKPRHNLMEILDDQSSCSDVESIFENITKEACLGPRRNETILRVYNCDSVKPPRPQHLARAMKQIYRPGFVLSHYVHYATVTAEIATYYADHPASIPGSNVSYVRNIRKKEWLSRETFLDEQTQGILIHARFVFPQQTMDRSQACYGNSTLDCAIGFPCPSSVYVVDGFSQRNGFHGEAGKYCNCWPNELLETELIPHLESQLLLHHRAVA